MLTKKILINCSVVLFCVLAIFPSVGFAEEWLPGADWRLSVYLVEIPVKELSPSDRSGRVLTLQQAHTLMAMSKARVSLPVKNGKSFRAAGAQIQGILTADSLNSDYVDILCSARLLNDLYYGTACFPMHTPVLLPNQLACTGSKSTTLCLLLGVADVKEDPGCEWGK